MITTGLARLGRDAEVRDANGTPVTDLSLAYNYGRRGDDNQYPTQWVKATLWGKLAESLEPYLKKGQMVDVVLEDVHVEMFTKQGGEQMASLVGRVLKIELAGRTGGTSTQAPAPAPAAKRPAAAPAPRAQSGGNSGGAPF